MQWEGREESENVEDRRGFNKKAGLAVGGAGGLLLIILGLIFGVDPQKLLNLAGQGPGGAPAGVQGNDPVDPAEDRMAKFSSVIFHDTEVVWDDLFNRMGQQYKKPRMVLFRNQVDSACGETSAAVGPFYCPGDSTVYIDLSFYKDMERKLNAPGEFARAYVIAHEVGHHVQRLLRFSRRVDDARRNGSKAEANQMSVRLELQADFLAGVWAHHAQEKFNFLDPGDVDNALNAAFQIGDDRLQKKAQGYVVPDAFTHGTSRQRSRWFGEGFKTGEVRRAGLLFSLGYGEL